MRDCELETVLTRYFTSSEPLRGTNEENVRVCHLGGFWRFQKQEASTAKWNELIQFRILLGNCNAKNSGLRQFIDFVISSNTQENEKEKQLPLRKDLLHLYIRNDSSS
ncbi:hypothetical protein TNCV_4389471 [Trichonephila clavipes]|nr:hypothetical protein TNCV_4389471 [Trichonephila clavipes]